MKTCWQASSLIKRCQLPLTHPLIEFIIKDNGLGYGWAERLVV